MSVGRGWRRQGRRRPSQVAHLSGSSANSLLCHSRPEVQDLDSHSQCPGLPSRKPEDAEEDEEDELDEEEDSLAGKSPDGAVSPAPEPQGTYEDEDEEPPAALALGFDRTRRWDPPGPSIMRVPSSQTTCRPPGWGPPAPQQAVSPRVQLGRGPP